VRDDNGNPPPYKDFVQQQKDIKKNSDNINTNLKTLDAVRNGVTGDKIEARADAQ